MAADQMRTWIDDATYEQLFGKYRFAPAGDPFLAGEIGEYFMAAMARKRAEVGPGAAVAASKAIGWSP